MTDVDWSTPHEVTDLDIAFGVDSLALMPSRQEAQEGLPKLSDGGRKWIDFQNKWFFYGLSKDVKIIPKDGINLDKALRHLSAIQGSWEPKHEHKEEAVAYLASLWFEDVIYGD